MVQTALKALEKAGITLTGKGLESNWFYGYTNLPDGNAIVVCVHTTGGNQIWTPYVIVHIDGPITAERVRKYQFSPRKRPDQRVENLLDLLCLIHDHLTPEVTSEL